VALQRDPTQLANPQGHGFGVATVQPDGTVRFTGTLGDGTATMQSGVVSKTGTWPFHALLYKNGGMLTGDLTFRTVAGVSDLDGTLDWIKPAFGGPTTTYPAGFTGRTRVIGARYDKTQAFPAGQVQVGEGGVGTVTDAVFTVDASGKITATPSTWTLKFVAASGLFSGSFPDPVTSKARKFGGAYLQIRRKGFGTFIGNPLPTPANGLSSGFVEIVP